MKKIFFVLFAFLTSAVLFAEISVDYNFKSNDTELLNATTYPDLDISKSKWNDLGLYLYSRGLRISYIEDKPNSELFRFVTSCGFKVFSLENPDLAFGYLTDGNVAVGLLLNDVRGFQLDWRFGEEFSVLKTDNFQIGIEFGIGFGISRIIYEGTMAATNGYRTIRDFYDEKAWSVFMEPYIYPSVAIGNKKLKLVAGWEMSYKFGYIKSECKAFGTSDSMYNTYKYFSNNARLGIKCNF